MNIIHKLLALSAAGILTATVAHAQTSIPVSNGSFELSGSNTDYAGNDYTVGQGATPDANLPDWTITNGTVGHFFINNGSHATIPNGSYYAGYWFSNTAGVDAQLTYSGASLGNLAADTTYTLTMSVGCPSYTGGSTSQTASIHLTGFDGTTTTDITSASASGLSNNTWVTVTATFDTGANSAFNGQAIGLFIDTNSTSTPAGGAVVNWDNVQLTSLANVPEPGTFAMLLGGVGMLTMLRRRRA